MKCYKVVTEELTSSLTKGSDTVHYKVGRYVRAPRRGRGKGYHLLVFLTKDQAIGFRSVNFWSGTQVRIYVAEGKGKAKKLPLKLAIVDGFVDWGASKWISNENWPHGTQMFKKVKLLRKIEG